MIAKVDLNRRNECLNIHESIMRPRERESARAHDFHIPQNTHTITMYNILYIRRMHMNNLTRKLRDDTLKVSHT